MKSDEQMLHEQTLNTSDSIAIIIMDKLELYKKISNEVNSFKEENDFNSYLYLKACKDDTKSIGINMSGLNYQIIHGDNIVDELKISIADLLTSTEERFTYLHEIQKKISRKFAEELSTRMLKILELRRNLKSAVVKEIAHIYGIKQENITGENKRKGIQDGFIINDTSTGLKIFVKTSKVWDDLECVDPRELFAYKVLEYMELGPETRFIFTTSISDSYGPKKCHIVTKDVAYSNDKDIKVFFTDNFIHKEDDYHIDAVEHWEKSLNIREFRVKFLTLSLVTDLLHLNDSLGCNAGNYGTKIQYKMDKSQYNAFIIDFEIIKSMFKYEPHKHPVISLIEKLKNHNNNNMKSKGDLISYKIIIENGWFVDQKQIKSETREAINAVNEKFSKVVKIAEGEI